MRSESSITGLVFDIQRCSLHDGPGIRTTVFLKGCPLHCRWCHNPESVGFEPQVTFNDAACVDCMACVDLFLFDYKATDAKRHRALTGVSNEQILINLDRLYRHGASILLRCPLVPGVNDDDEHLRGIAALADEYRRLEGIEIMPYHDMGRDKALRLGQRPELVDLKTVDEATKTRWMTTLQDLGCTRRVRLG